MSLSEKQKERYSRNTLIKEVGEAGQEKLLSSKVLVIGAGGLGSPNLLYLAAVGVGTIGIVDGDNVDLSNLQRQVIHRMPDIGKPKVDSAKRKIQDLNPDVNVITYHTKVNADNISEIIKDYNFIIECTDNFQAKFLINDACVLNKKPYSHCGVLVFYGQILTYIPGKACLRCLFSAPPPPDAVQSSNRFGIFGTVPGIFGTLQAIEAVKYMLGIGKLFTNTLFHFDALNFESRSIKLQPNPKCPICGEHPTITKVVMSDAS
jgi:molybdopterin-synthase adenylyltransferase